jgi:hypothetical protein
MKFKTKNLNLAVCLAGATLASSVVFDIQPAQAVIFSYGGTDYDITTATGSFNSLESQITSTPWWNNPTLAYGLAIEIGSDLGVPNGLWYGPWFGFRSDYEIFVGILLFDTYNGRIETGYDLKTPVYTWAVEGSNVTAVPEPLTILGSITAAGFGVAFKRKKTSKKNS